MRKIYRYTLHILVGIYLASLQVYGSDGELQGVPKDPSKKRSAGEAFGARTVPLEKPKKTRRIVDEEASDAESPIKGWLADPNSIDVRIPENLGDYLRNQEYNHLERLSAALAILGSDVSSDDHFRMAATYVTDCLNDIRFSISSRAELACFLIEVTKDHGEYTSIYREAALRAAEWLGDKRVKLGVRAFIANFVLDPTKEYCGLTGARLDEVVTYASKWLLTVDLDSLRQSGLVIGIMESNASAGCLIPIVRKLFKHLECHLDTMGADSDGDEEKLGGDSIDMFTTVLHEVLKRDILADCHEDAARLAISLFGKDLFINPKDHGEILFAILFKDKLETHHEKAAKLAIKFFTADYNYQSLIDNGDGPELFRLLQRFFNTGYLEKYHAPVAKVALPWLQKPDAPLGREIAQAILSNPLLAEHHVEANRIVSPVAQSS